MNRELIALLSEAGSFNPRHLHFSFPFREAFSLLSLDAKFFISLFSEKNGISIDNLINDEWRKDSYRLFVYNRLSDASRQEIHVLIGYILHETIHKVDMLASPFGLNYLSLLIEEYCALQDYIPRIMDRKNFIEAFPIFSHVGKSIPSAVMSAELQDEWLRLEEIVRKAVAWGDMGNFRPSSEDVVLGWDDDFHQGGTFFGTVDVVEPVRVMGYAFWTFRLAGETNRYFKPASVLETKAMAGTMLYIMQISPNFRDVSAYFDSVYPSNTGIDLDYFVTFNILARIFDYQDFSEVLATAGAQDVRTLLLIAQSICWFALQAPPLVRGATFAPRLAGNPALRLFTALATLPETLRDERCRARGTGTALLEVIEKHQMFEGLDQIGIAEALERCVVAIPELEKRINDILHPEVRTHFHRILSITKPIIDARQPNYGSRLGQPDHGNPRTEVQSMEEMEIFFHDHNPSQGYAEWLSIRNDILFTHLIPDDDMVRRLYEHFDRPFAIVPCFHCDQVHRFMASRFEIHHKFVCPNTGEIIEISPQNIRHIFLKPDDDENNESGPPCAERAPPARMRD